MTPLPTLVRELFTPPFQAYPKVVFDANGSRVVEHMRPTYCHFVLVNPSARVGDEFGLSRDKAGWAFKSDNVTSQLVPGIVGTVGPTPGEAMMVAMELMRRGGF